jgi:hypothetical protein
VTQSATGYAVQHAVSAPASTAHLRLAWCVDLLDLVRQPACGLCSLSAVYQQRRAAGESVGKFAELPPVLRALGAATGCVTTLPAASTALRRTRSSCCVVILVLSVTARAAAHRSAQIAPFAHQARRRAAAQTERCATVANRTRRALVVDVSRYDAVMPDLAPAWLRRSCPFEVAVAPTSQPLIESPGNSGAVSANSASAPVELGRPADDRFEAIGALAACHVHATAWGGETGHGLLDGPPANAEEAVVWIRSLPATTGGLSA